MVNRHAKLEFNNKKSRLGARQLLPELHVNCHPLTNFKTVFPSFSNDGNDLKSRLKCQCVRQQRICLCHHGFERQKTTIISLINEGTKTRFLL